MTSIATTPDRNEGWILSSPGPQKPAPAHIPFDQAKRAAMRAHAADILAERRSQGLTADGRILDMGAYSRHLQATA